MCLARGMYDSEHPMCVTLCRSLSPGCAAQGCVEGFVACMSTSIYTPVCDREHALPHEVISAAEADVW